MQSKQKILLLDFDNTIIDSERFCDHLGDVLQEYPMGIPKEIYLSASDAIRKSGKLYHIHRHLDFIQSIDRKYSVVKANRIVEAVMPDIKGYIFKDIFGFFKYLNRQGWKCVLLTYGHPSWQREKMYASGLIDFFDAMKYTRDRTKIRPIRALLKKHYRISFTRDLVVMVDDNADVLEKVKRTQSGIHCIQLSHADIKGKKSRRTNSKDINVLSGFVKVAEFLEGLVSAEEECSK